MESSSKTRVDVWRICAYNSDGLLRHRKGKGVFEWTLSNLLIQSLFSDLLETSMTALYKVYKAVWEISAIERTQFLPDDSVSL